MVLRDNDLALAMMLHVSYPHRWGNGKVHIWAGPYRDTLCAEYLHGYHREGDISEVTCKKCIRSWLRYLNRAPSEHLNGIASAIIDGMVAEEDN